MQRTVKDGYRYVGLGWSVMGWSSLGGMMYTDTVLIRNHLSVLMNIYNAFAISVLAIPGLTLEGSLEEAIALYHCGKLPRWEYER